MSTDLDPDGTRRLIAQVDNETFDPAVNISTGAVTVTNETELSERLADILDSIYAINIQEQNGLFIQNAVGPPYGGDCPFKKNVSN